ncbi:hypothetical protein ACFV9E_39010 [Streptomyces sp. NPDC059835]|uniref:hypothetical protein n=1 Tax=Streptomyces sp. NPDC059835 TaxID=3346967 RepID=UPI00365F1626
MKEYPVRRSIAVGVVAAAIVAGAAPAAHAALPQVRPAVAADEAAATFYTGRAYAGPALGLEAQGECVNLPAGFNDRIASVGVASGVAVEVFEDAGCAGSSLEFFEDIDNLGSFTGKVSSVRVRYGTGG